MNNLNLTHRLSIVFEAGSEGSLLSYVKSAQQATLWKCRLCTGYSWQAENLPLGWHTSQPGRLPVTPLKATSGTQDNNPLTLFVSGVLQSANLLLMLNTLNLFLVYNVFKKTEL